MRILLALDGSPSADAACRLVASLAWPEGTVIQAVAVAEPAAELISPLAVSAPAIGSLDRQASEELRRILDEAVATLAQSSLVAHRTVLVGRPGTLIVDAAADFRADLVVVGSRGRGLLTSMLLGSVSAEVVDHAPCPVLVARHPAVGSLLVAVDGSLSARAAVSYLVANRLFTGRQVEVLTVTQPVELAEPFELGSVSGLALESTEQRRLEERERAESIAAGAAQTLSDSGYPAHWLVSDGNPAREIADAAAGFGSGLIVMGSRGLSGPARIVLGSVARSVLQHTSTSVLIVRAPVPAQPPARVSGPVGTEAR